MRNKLKIYRVSFGDILNFQTVTRLPCILFSEGSQKNRVGTLIFFLGGWQSNDLVNRGWGMDMTKTPILSSDTIKRRKLIK